MSQWSTFGLERTPMPSCARSTSGSSPPSKERSANGRFLIRNRLKPVYFYPNWRSTDKVYSGSTRCRKINSSEIPSNKSGKIFKPGNGRFEAAWTKASTALPKGPVWTTSPMLLFWTETVNFKKSLSMSVIPKVCSADHWWSTRLAQGVLEINILCFAEYLNILSGPRTESLGTTVLRECNLHSTLHRSHFVVKRWIKFVS